MLNFVVTNILEDVNTNNYYESRSLFDGVI